MTKILKVSQYLSLDVVMGSLAVGYMAIRMFEVDPNPWWWLVLSLAVWVVYSSDHLLDGLRLKSKATIPRHLFYFNNSKILIHVVFAAAIIALYLSIVHLDMTIVISGLVLSAITLLYFFILNYADHRVRSVIPKEIIIALIYTGGIFLAPLIWYGQVPDPLHILIIMVLVILAFSEGVMLSYFDYKKDMDDGHSSFTIRYGKSATQRFLTILHITVEISLLLALFKSESVFIFTCLILLIIMNFALGIIAMFPNQSCVVRNHKLLGEMVFVLPALLYFI